MVQPGDSVPHLEVRTLQGEQFCYSTIWRRRNLVFVTLSVSEFGPRRALRSQLLARGSDFARQGAECVFHARPPPVAARPRGAGRRRQPNRWSFELRGLAVPESIAASPAPRFLTTAPNYVQTCSSDGTAWLD